MIPRAAFLVLFGSLFGTAACAKGKPIGELDLFAKDAALTVQASQGDTLHFRVDVSVDMAELESTRGEKRGSAAKDALHRSQLTINVRDKSGATAAVSCPLDGSGTMQSMSGSKLTETGLNVSCKNPITSAGAYVITASVVWQPGIKPLSGKLEVRLAKP